MMGQPLHILQFRNYLHETAEQALARVFATHSLENMSNKEKAERVNEEMRKAGFEWTLE